MTTTKMLTELGAIVDTSQTGQTNGDRNFAPSSSVFVCAFWGGFAFESNNKLNWHIFFVCYCENCYPLVNALDM